MLFAASSRVRVQGSAVTGSQQRVQLLLAEFEPEALDSMSISAQLQLTRTLVRNLAERLELANTRLK